MENNRVDDSQPLAVGTTLHAAVLPDARPTKRLVSLLLSTRRRMNETGASGTRSRLALLFYAHVTAPFQLGGDSRWVALARGDAKSGGWDLEMACHYEYILPSGFFPNPCWLRSLPRAFFGTLREVASSRRDCRRAQQLYLTSNP